MKPTDLMIQTLTEAVAALVRRMGEVESVARIPGEQGVRGEDGKDGRDGKDAEPVSDEQIKSAATEWLKANITQPADGRDGADGRDADTITAEQIQLAVDLWFEINRDSIRGADGRDGVNGRDGQDGKNGQDGRNGREGADGTSGQDGIGIASIEQPNEETARIILTDGREIDLKLPRGAPGLTQTIVRGGGQSSGPVSGGGVTEIIAGSNVTIDDSDPARPIISAADPKTGWGLYRDTEYTSVAPFEITDGAFVTLQNNAGTKNETYLPVGVLRLYDETTQKLTPAQVGNYNTITIRFRAIATASSTYIDFGVDTGGPMGAIFRDTKVFPKGAGVEHSFSFVCPGFSSANFVTNGGLVKIGPVGGDIDVYDIEYQIVRIHSA